MNIETERAWHARHLVSELTLQELNSYDGIVAVSVQDTACCFKLGMLRFISLNCCLASCKALFEAS